MRRFYEQALLRELRTAFRNHQPLALIMLDFGQAFLLLFEVKDTP